MPKNIVICCYETRHAFGARSSNVLKLYKILVRDSDQTVYYHPGGTAVVVGGPLARISQVGKVLIGIASGGVGLLSSIANLFYVLPEALKVDDLAFGYEL